MLENIKKLQFLSTCAPGILGLEMGQRQPKAKCAGTKCYGRWASKI